MPLNKNKDHPMDTWIDEAEKDLEKTKACKGLIFRANINRYVSSHRSIEVKKSLRLLKRQSCKGCEKCEWLWDYIQDDMYDAGAVDYIGELDDGKKYKIKPIWSPGTYEYPDEEELTIEFERVK